MTLVDAAERQILDLEFGRTTYTPPVIYYVALTTSVPTDAVVGAAPTWPNYARVAVPNTAAFWPVAVTTANKTVKQNAQIIRFQVAGTVASPIPILGFELYDALTGGTRRLWGTVTASASVTSGKRPVFLVGSLGIVLD